jgi:glycosyltransferase involved in cell wall biosynthesis
MALEEPLVTVVIPAYNGQRWIERTLASAISQTYYNLEIVVVDDGSTDQTATIVEQAASRDRRIRLLRQQNAGAPAARNFGIREARGTLIAPLDADDLWHPEKLARQVATLQASPPTVGLVYCWAVEIDENDLVIPPIRSGSTAAGNVMSELVAKAGIIDSASNPLIRRSYLDAVGGYDSNRTLGTDTAEDWKLYLALAEICEFAVVTAHLVGYRRLTGSMSRKIAKMEQGMELVARWIVEKWPNMPRETVRQMNYHKDIYLAHLALTTNDFSNAFHFQMRSYKTQPMALLTVESLKFYVRLVARMAGLKRSNLPLRAKPIAFKDLRLSPSRIKSKS